MVVIRHTMNKVSQPVSKEALLHAVEDFLIPLRMGEGFKTDAYQHLLQTIRAFHSTYRENESVPKWAVSIFMDTFPAVDSCQTLYKGEEKQAVIDAAIAIWECILEGFEN